jgi:hypothetical protein
MTSAATLCFGIKEELEKLIGQTIKAILAPCSLSIKRMFVYFQG